MNTTDVRSSKDSRKKRKKERKKGLFLALNMLTKSFVVNDRWL